MYIRFNGMQAGGWGRLHVVDMPAPEDDIDTVREDIPGGDGMFAGADSLRSSMWNITLLVNTYSYAEGRAVVNMVRDAWLDPDVRLSGTMHPLEYSKDGEAWFRVYGRPVNYGGPPQGTRLDQGVAYIELQFEQLDPLHYSSSESEVSIPVAQGASGGLRFPLRFPVSFGRSGSATDRWAANEGVAPAPVRLRFDGPMSDPVVSLQDGWTFRLDGSLAWDEYLVVDSRARSASIFSTTGPGVRSAFSWIRGGGRFGDLVIPPGEHALSFSAIDSTYTATMTASWPHVYRSMQ